MKQKYIPKSIYQKTEFFKKKNFCLETMTRLWRGYNESLPAEGRLEFILKSLVLGQKLTTVNSFFYIFKIFYFDKLKYENTNC